MRCAVFLALLACESNPGDKPDDSGDPDDTAEETGLPLDMGFDLDGAWSGATFTRARGAAPRGWRIHDEPPKFETSSAPGAAEAVRVQIRMPAC